MVAKFNLNAEIKPIIADIQRARAHEGTKDWLVRVISQLFGYQMYDQELAAVELYKGELKKELPDDKIRQKIKEISTRTLFQSAIQEYDANYKPPAPTVDTDNESEATLPFIPETPPPPPPPPPPPSQPKPQQVIVEIRDKRADVPKSEQKKPGVDPKKFLLSTNGIYSMYVGYYTYQGLSRISTAAASIGHSLKVLSLSAAYNAYNSGGQLRPLAATVTDPETLSWCMNELQGNAFSCSHPVFPLRTTFILAGAALATTGAYSAYNYITAPTTTTPEKEPKTA